MSANAEHRGVYASAVSAPQDNIEVVRTNFRAEFAPRFGASDEHLLWIRGDALVAQPFDSAKLRLHGEVAEVTNVVGTGALGFAHFSVSSNGILLYAVGQFGKRNIEWWDRRGAAMKTAASSGIYYAPRLSPDGSRVAIARVEPPNSDVWVYEFGRGTMVRLTVEPGFDNMPVWSPNGNKLVFSASRGGARNLYIRSATGAGEEPLTQSSHPQYPSDWSRDGRYIVFTEVHPSSDGDIWLARADGTSRPVKPEPFLVTLFNETHGRISPDGRLIAYSSNQSGRYEVYVQTFPATGRKLVGLGSRRDPSCWRADGRELFYVSENSRLMSVDVGALGSGLTLSQPRDLFAVPVRVGENFYDYDAALDGKRFIMLPYAVQGTPEPLNLLMNWHAARQR